MAMASILATGLSAAGNATSSMGSAMIQAQTSKNLQQSQMDYNTGVMSRAEKSFTDVGLPRYMAYGGGTHLPGQQFQLSGGNMYDAGLVGQNVPFLHTIPQIYTHTGIPKSQSENKVISPRPRAQSEPNLLTRPSTPSSLTSSTSSMSWDSYNGTSMDSSLNSMTANNTRAFASQDPNRREAARANFNAFFDNPPTRNFTGGVAETSLTTPNAIMAPNGMRAMNMTWQQPNIRPVPRPTTGWRALN